MSILLYGCTSWTLTKRIEKSLGYIAQILEATSHETAFLRPPTSHLLNYPNKTNKTLLEKQGRTYKRRSPIGPLHVYVAVLADQQELSYNKYVRTQDVV